MSQVNLSSSWTDSWDWNNPTNQIKINYETRFSMMIYEIEQNNKKKKKKKNTPTRLELTCQTNYLSYEIGTPYRKKTKINREV
jgi:outer membrane usher protein FimD/PapC